jgi:hypothetical protein
MVVSADALLKTVDRRLSELLALGDDWDSYGGKAPTATAVLLAGRLTRGVYDRYGAGYGEAALPASISPLAYGGVELEWEGAHSLVAVDIGPDGEMGAMLRHRTGQDAIYRETENLGWDETLDQVGAVLRAPS